MKFIIKILAHLQNYFPKFKEKNYPKQKIIIQRFLSSRFKLKNVYS